MRRRRSPRFFPVSNRRSTASRFGLTVQKNPELSEAIETSV
jgi:hypothetical protein